MERKHHKDDHYRNLVPQPIDVIERYGLGYKTGNVVKYIARAEFKGQRADDYKKALGYLRMLESHIDEYRAYIDDYICAYTLPIPLPKWGLPHGMEIVLDAMLNPSWEALDIATKFMEQFIKEL